VVLLIAPSAAMAGEGAAAAGIVNTWDFSPVIVIPTLLVLAIYAAGLERRPGAFDASPWRHMAFFWGGGMTFLSLASPIDALADHLFFMHQVQHMLIRVIGPMLIALAQPQATLIAGLPASVRRKVLGPVASAGPVSALFRFLTRPVVATALFVASLYIWQWPPLHDAAILHQPIHDVMHFTMLAAGLLFFWRVFDQRGTPKGVPFGARLMMLWVAVLANIPIGAYISFKSHELYSAYDVVGRLFGISPMDDERLGGFIMQAPSSMMMLVAVIAVIHAWGRFEERVDDRRLSLIAVAPTAAAPAPAVGQTRRNRALALGLGAFAACMLGAAVTVGVLAAYGHARPPTRMNLSGVGPAPTGTVAVGAKL